MKSQRPNIRFLSGRFRVFGRSVKTSAKHIKRHYNFVREHATVFKTITAKYVKSDANRADLMTKSLRGNKFREALKMLKY